MNSFQNSQCKYIDSIGQEPCHAKSRHVCAKGILEYRINCWIRPGFIAQLYA
jgi:hypothetical protein